MKYIEIKLRTTTEASDVAAHLLEEIGCGGAVIEDRNAPEFDVPADAWAIPDPAIREAMDTDVLVTGYLPEGSEHTVEGMRARIEELRAMDLGGLDLGSMTIETHLIDEDDWANNWKQFYKPLRIGKRLVVKPSWEAYEAMPNDVVLELDPGMAFGTGTHETTAMCLELIEDVVKPGMRVLDAGCGSGILSMGAALLGGKVEAFDVDETAVKIAWENIARAGLSDSIRVRRGDILQDKFAPADLTVANIIADIIITAAPSMARAGGRIIASGIIREREADVEQAFAAVGFRSERVLRQGEWVAMLLAAGSA